MLPFGRPMLPVAPRPVRSETPPLPGRVMSVGHAVAVAVAVAVPLPLPLRVLLPWLWPLPLAVPPACDQRGRRRAPDACRRGPCSLPVDDEPGSLRRRHGRASPASSSNGSPWRSDEGSAAGAHGAIRRTACPSGGPTRRCKGRRAFRRVHVRSPPGRGTVRGGRRRRHRSVTLGLGPPAARLRHSPKAARSLFHAPPEAGRRQGRAAFGPSASRPMAAGPDAGRSPPGGSARSATRPRPRPRSAPARPDARPSSSGRRRCRRVTRGAPAHRRKDGNRRRVVRDPGRDLGEWGPYRIHERGVEGVGDAQRRVGTLAGKWPRILPSAPSSPESTTSAGPLTAATHTSGSSATNDATVGSGARTASIPPPGGCRPISRPRAQMSSHAPLRSNTPASAAATISPMLCPTIQVGSTPRASRLLPRDHPTANSAGCAHWVWSSAWSSFGVVAEYECPDGAPEVRRHRLVEGGHGRAETPRTGRRAPGPSRGTAPPGR
jgi:hypothetical protein